MVRPFVFVCFGCLFFFLRLLPTFVLARNSICGLSVAGTFDILSFLGRLGAKSLAACVWPRLPVLQKITSCRTQLARRVELRRQVCSELLGRERRRRRGGRRDHRDGKALHHARQQRPRGRLLQGGVDGLRGERQTGCAPFQTAPHACRSCGAPFADPMHTGGEQPLATACVHGQAPCGRDSMCAVRCKH